MTGQKFDLIYSTKSAEVGVLTENFSKVTNITGCQVMPSNSTQYSSAHIHQVKFAIFFSVLSLK